MDALNGITAVNHGEVDWGIEVEYQLVNKEKAAEVIIGEANESLEGPDGDCDEDDDFLFGQIEDDRDHVSLDPLVAGEAGTGGEGSPNGEGSAFSPREALIQAFNNDPGEANIRKYDAVSRSGLAKSTARPERGKSFIDMYDPTEEGVDVTLAAARMQLPNVVRLIRGQTPIQN